MKKSLVEKDEYYREELIRQQTNTDRDIMELRRLMDKIDMSHHNKYEKLMLDHEQELGKLYKLRTFFGRFDGGATGIK